MLIIPMMLILCIIIVMSIKHVPENTICVIKRNDTVSVKEYGYFFVLPFMDKVFEISQNTKQISLYPQPIISKDNIFLQATVDVYFHVVDAALYVGGANNTRDTEIEVFICKIMREIVSTINANDIKRDIVFISQKLKTVAQESALNCFGVQLEHTQLILLDK